MIFHPWIIGIILGDFTIMFLLILGAVNAGKINKHWDFGQSNHLQYQLEKKTYLVSAIMNFTMGIQIVLILLFVFAAEEISKVLPGAMCATGTLTANSYGFPLLFLKLFLGFLSFFWLVINYIDNQIENYPLIKEKYQLLIILTPLFLFQPVLTYLFVSDLDPSIITSCCGVVFNEQQASIGGFLVGLDTCLLLSTLVGLYLLIVVKNNCYWKLKWWKRLPFFDILLWGCILILGLATIVNFTSIYIYEMPTHRCPFCLLQAEYYYIGIPIYFSLFLGVATGISKNISLRLEYLFVADDNMLMLKTKLNKHSIIWLTVFMVFAFAPFVIYYLKTGSTL
jgi:hypothetical protein